MRILARIAGLIVFLILLGFALRNSAIVTLRFFFNTEWHLPLVFVLFAFFSVGAVVGLLTALPTIFRQRREIIRLKRYSHS